MVGNNRIVKVSSIKDIDNIKEDTKYINIDITNPDIDILNFFIRNGENYLYSEIIDNVPGYIYVSYEEFYKAESIINGIYANMPNDLTELEASRYLYTSIPKYVSYDINNDIDKAEENNIYILNKINNIWGSISLGKINDKSISKIYYYLLKRIGISASMITSISNDTYINLFINKQNIVTDIYNDVPFIEAHMKTTSFGTYNSDNSLDKKIKYINKHYLDDLIDKELKHIDYTKGNNIEEILVKLESILDIKKIKPLELSIIINRIFKEYLPMYKVNINNLYLNNKEKSHFLIISYNDYYYSYNYKKDNFVRISELDIKNNLKNGTIGLYLNEPKMINI